MAVTCITFVFWGVGPARVGNGSGGGGGEFGTIYGHKLTQQDFIMGKRVYYIFFRIHYGEWPDKNPNLSNADLEREIYVHLLFDQKAADLGIYISDDVVEQTASEMLRSLGRNGQALPMDVFVKQILQPEGLTAADFERYIRHDLIIQQLVQTIGLPGSLVTPQEAAGEYEREYREFSVQAVFFSPSNYLSGVTVMPAAVMQFYTNYLATYRLPNRVQVSYVAFNKSNYLAQAKAEWAKTNFEDVVEANYRDVGPNYFPDAKTPDAAKAKIRELLIQNRALANASQQANDFASTLFALEPAKPENLAVVAKQKGLTVQLTAPFANASGPEGIATPAEFIRAAFLLTPDEPLAGPIITSNTVYVIALAKQMPSEIPPFDQIRGRVTDDYRMHEATILAQRAGTNFVQTLTTQMAAGHTFASACVTAGLEPQALPPFSMATRELPELGDRAELDQLKQAAFSTPVGHTSGFVETGGGGFVLYVQSQLPVDRSAMSERMPQFMIQLRREQQNAAFNQWLQIEAGRELRNIPALVAQAAAGNR